MRIAIIDKVPILKEDIERLKALGSLTYHKDYCENQEERRERCRDQDIIITDIASKIDEHLLSQNPNIRFISQFATGVDNIDTNACHRYGIHVSNVRDYCSRTLAEFCYALIANMTRNIFLADKHVEQGGWDYSLFEGVELSGKSIGIVGSGSTGRAMVHIARGYGMKPLVYTKNPTEEKQRSLGIDRFVDLKTLLTQSDFISLHVPLTGETYHMIGENEFNLMKDGVYLINTARGAIIDSSALLGALQSGKIAGAALDVLEEDEPVDFLKVSDTTKQIIDHHSTIVTPHIAFYSSESVRRLSKQAVDNVEAFVRGEPINTVV